ncbi:hypothetical protein TRICI_006271 [Trichomonascus ciferrii]|uniref:Uncharacterized protein n=1 Tax=Trichomonascus ciferrii TaxID=44093 RepID=A0A642UJ67_9ASCO|nr:hypothetical protein TRICI_006271 [Trichomonascus ciferrii]
MSRVRHFATKGRPSKTGKVIPTKGYSQNIIDNIFDDENLFNDRSPAGLTDELYKSGKTQPYATPESPFAKTANEIRGVHSPFIERFFAQRHLTQVPTVYSCPYYVAYYFPPWSYVSAGRKSRPALASLYLRGQQHNGVAVNKMDYKPTVVHRSKNPIDYAYWRVYISRSLKHALFTTINSTPEAPDGTFLFRSKRVPTNQAELQSHMDRTVKNAINMVNSKDQLQWVDRLNAKNSWPQLNSRLSSKFKPPAKIYSRAQWAM